MVFLLMVVEDFFFQTVDLRAALILAVSAFGSALAAGNSLTSFLFGAVFGLGFSGLVYIAGLYKPVRADSILPSVVPNLSFGFLPSLAIAILLWLFFVPAGQQALWLAFMDLFQVADMGWIIAALTFTIVVYKAWRLSDCRLKELTSGFGAGDVIVCTVLGGFFGWQAFVGIFFIALWVHLGICFLLLVAEAIKFNQGGMK